MALTIIGNYPILNDQKSSVDENGIQTLSYVFTVKTSDAIEYIPLKDDEYYGPDWAGNQSFLDPRTGTNPSKYKVTEVSTSNMAGGLTQINVNTVGAVNIQTPPKIRLIPNSQMIWGIQGVKEGNANATGLNFVNVKYVGDGNPRSGYGISVSFITESDNASEGFVFENYFNKIMPTEIYGVRLPTPAREPYSITAGGIGWGYAEYKGFICYENTYQRVGGVTLFTLIYKEIGNAVRFIWPSEEEARATSAAGLPVIPETQVIYNFQ